MSFPRDEAAALALVRCDEDPAFLARWMLLCERLKARLLAEAVVVGTEGEDQRVAAEVLARQVAALDEECEQAARWLVRPIDQPS